MRNLTKRVCQWPQDKELFLVTIYIEPTLMYGCESWTITKPMQEKIEAAEMWFLKRMLRIQCTEKDKT